MWRLVWRRLRGCCSVVQMGRGPGEVSFKYDGVPAFAGMTNERGGEGKGWWGYEDEII